MNNTNLQTSDRYQDYLIDYLSKNPQLAAEYINETLTEENPEPQLLQQAINQVYTALSAQENLSLNSLLNSSEAEAIYKFIDLLNAIGLKINISLVDALFPLQDKDAIYP
jgi:DNA-binding phage protein